MLSPHAVALGRPAGAALSSAPHVSDTRVPIERKPSATPFTTPLPPMRLPPLLALMRPHQWLKNVFVFAGLVFSQSWHDADRVAQVLAAFGVFCLFSSAVYIANDWADRASDALHPTKRLRPLASGRSRLVGCSASLARSAQSLAM